MLYIRKLFTQDLRDGKQIAFPKEPSYSFFSFDYQNNEADRRIVFTFNARFEQFQEYDGKVITTRLYSSGSESRMDGEVKAFIRDELNAKVDDLLIFKNKGTKYTEFEVMFVPQNNKYYSLLLKMCGGENHSVYSTDLKITFDGNEPLQCIYYGAPGTGKSHEIKEKTNGEAVIRTTFHPDSDYSTFVGAYKPVMEDVDVKVVPVVLNNGASFDQNNGTFKEKRIAYKFVKQAFLKAYLGAWKKYADGCSICNVCSTPTVHKFNTGNVRYVITSVGDYELTLSREFKFHKNLVQSEWQNLWKNGTFEVPKGQQSGKSVQHAIASWIFDKINACTKDSFNEGWDKLVDTVRKNGPVAVQKTQTYIIIGVADDNETLTINVEARGKKRATLRRKFYESDEIKPSKLEKTLVDILKGYDSVFDDAWERLKQEINKGVTPEVKDESDGQIDPQFLIIEEINRGNCAQIFGDIFQLLDRGDNGFSVYPIEADSDLRDAIKEAFTKEDEYLLSSDIDIEGVIEYTSNYGATLSEDVQEGRVLLLPSNLYIWATMNTSDQSLFPIDSAFKRRWDWIYMPIENAEKGWKIKVNRNEYEWYKFLDAINKEVLDLTHSEDKQLGYFFAKAKDGFIDAETLVNKVYFYLWTDVFKDYDYESQKAFRKPNSNEPIAFKDFFKKGQELDEIMAEQVLINLELEKLNKSQNLFE